MLVYHQTGHNLVWNCDSYTADNAGAGLIFSPVNIQTEKIIKIDNSIKHVSFFDPQFYLLKELKGKLDGIAIRVPVPTGSATDFVCELEKETTIEEINKLFKSVAENELKNVIQYTDEPLVSSDIVGNPNSCIFDSLSTHVMDGKFIKILGWYDNEWGYSSRMVDMVKIIMEK